MTVFDIAYYQVVASSVERVQENLTGVSLMCNDYITDENNIYLWRTIYFDSDISHSIIYNYCHSYYANVMNN